MERRLLALIVLGIFVLGTAPACAYRNHVPPGQIKKQSAPGQKKKLSDHGTVGLRKVERV